MILIMLVPVNLKRKSTPCENQNKLCSNFTSWSCEFFRQISGGRNLVKTDAVEDFGNLKVIDGKMPRSSLTSIRKGGRISPVSNVSSFEKILSQILGIPSLFLN